jgi:predicted nucleic acid-binding protein
LIAYLDRQDRANDVACWVVDGLVRSGRNSGLISMVTVTEVLVGPARSGDRELYAEIVEFLTQLPGLRLQEIDFRVAERAATLRARFRLRAADALIIATGLAAGVGRIVSNDREWSTRLPTSATSASVVLLDDHLPFTA